MKRAPGREGRAAGSFEKRLGKWPAGFGPRFFDPFYAAFDDGTQRLKSAQTKPLTVNGKMG